MSDFQVEVDARISANATDAELNRAGAEFMRQSIRVQYSYNFAFLGRPIIQGPQDIVAMQDLIWRVRPDLIIETGIAHGGSLVLSASVLALLDYCDAVAAGTALDPSRPARKVLGIDIDIRAHNRAAIEAHPMAGRIEMIQGSSIDPKIVKTVRERARWAPRILVVLDSNHSHDHVLGELEAYAPLTSVDSYCVVFDTIIENLPSGSHPGRPWNKGNNPMTAVDAYLSSNHDFEIDLALSDQLIVSAAPGGFLKRLRCESTSNTDPGAASG